MKADYKSLEERLHEERLDFFKKIAFQRQCEKQIDFVVNNEWLQSQRKAILSCDISTWMFNQLTISISQVPIEEFIENVLGPFHLEFDVFWRMDFDGDENDPVFVFTTTESSYDFPKFRVKEGIFKVCKFVSEIDGFTTAGEPRPIFKLQMVCE